MKAIHKYIILITVIILVFQSCSRKKNNILSRNYHALTTKYNVLYNGDLALQRGILSVNNEFTENFWQLLPVERMDILSGSNLRNRTTKVNLDNNQTDNETGFLDKIANPFESLEDSKNILNDFNNPLKNENGQALLGNISNPLNNDNENTNTTNRGRDALKNSQDNIDNISSDVNDFNDRINSNVGNLQNIIANDNPLTKGFNALQENKNLLQNELTNTSNLITKGFSALTRNRSLENQIVITRESKDPNFRVAEAKAAKAINMHSININEREKNYQIDEAYLLLGKARYYDQRFVPALAAFNNILNKYPTSSTINKVKIWREKANMRLGNNEIAIKRLKTLLAESELKDQDFADATATLAQAYMNIQFIDSAVVHLKTAASYTKLKHEKARYHYIRGQIFNELVPFDKVYIDSANVEFDVIIDMHRKIPRAYYINAHIEKAKNFDALKGSPIEFKEYLTKMEENRENRPYLDKIYYAIAEFHKNQNQDSLAEVYYNKSISSPSSDRLLMAVNYETLGNMYFDKNVYKTAGAYYDSTLAFLVKKTKPYRILKKKRDNLDDVILYEGIAKTTDSILYVLSLSEEERLNYYTQYVENLKAEAIKAKEEADTKENSRDITSTNESNNVNQKNQIVAKQNRGFGSLSIDFSDKANNTFYFYTKNVAYGKKQFKQRWGNRKLQDNWRLSNQLENLQTQKNEIINDTISVEDDTRFKPETYIANLPKTEVEKDSIMKVRNNAYFQLGVIYKEKFNELELSVSKFTDVLASNPEERLIVPSKYNLYKIYLQQRLAQKAANLKKEIITQHPESRYAEILINPYTAGTGENSPETKYTALYTKYINQEYDALLNDIETELLRFQDDPYLPKFELLKATAQGRYLGFKAYKEGLNFVALNYPDSAEGIKAQDIINSKFQYLEKSEFVNDSMTKKFKIIYPFDTTSEKTAADSLFAMFKTKVPEIPYYNLKVSKDVYTKDTTFVVIHGLRKRGTARGLGKILKEDKKDDREELIRKGIPDKFFTISSKNYAILQRHKNFSHYLSNQKTIR